MNTATSGNTPPTTQSKIATLALRKVRKLNSQVKELAQRCADLENVVARAEEGARLAVQQGKTLTQHSPHNKRSRKRKVSGAERRASRTDSLRRSAMLGAYVASLRVERASRLMDALAKRRASDAIAAAREEARDATRAIVGGIGSHSYNVATPIEQTGYTMGCELKRSVLLDRESKGATRF